MMPTHLYPLLTPPPVQYPPPGAPPAPATVVERRLLADGTVRARFDCGCVMYVGPRGGHVQHRHR